MFKFLRVPPSFIDRLDKAPIPINDYRAQARPSRVDDMPSLVRMISEYCQITTWQGDGGIRNSGPAQGRHPTIGAVDGNRTRRRGEGH